MVSVHLLDYIIIATYLIAVVGIGYFLQGRAKTSEEFFSSDRSLPSWVTGLAFISANLGSLEVMGHAANAAKYGMMAASVFYWLGAIPAMVFLGVYMMPFYYQNHVRSSPEYLKLRFDERARGFNAIGFAVLTIFMSGINMYAMALIFKVFLNWPVNISVWLSAIGVMAYIYLGGLRAAIYNEVIQFFLIFLGLLPLSLKSLHEVGGWNGLIRRLPFGYMHAYAGFKHPESSPMGVPWYAIIAGFTVFAGTSYWCTDFLVVQRAMAARDLNAARQTPLIGAFFKMILPVVIVLPGLVALAVMPEQIRGHYDMVIPLMLERYYHTGLLGVGLTALLASFMSGMAGNITAFNTVWTFDIYQAYLRPKLSEQHYVRMGRIATVAGCLLSVATSYLVMRFNNMGDYLVLIFALFIFPMSTAFLLGMFWKRTTATGAFYGMVVGVIANVVHYFLYRFGLLHYRTEMAANTYIIIVGWLLGFAVAVGLSLVTMPYPDSRLQGLVYSLSSREDRSRGNRFGPSFLGAVLLVALLLLAWIFW
jgi:solute:Na+ symporter, SSS family